VAGPSNTQFALGVHMLTLLAGSDPAALSSDDMAGSAQSNPVHVRRVLGLFREAGLVTSRPGVGGGWRLRADPETTTLADVWRVVHGPGADVLGLRSANPACPVGRSIQASLAAIGQDAARAVQAELRRTTIAQLVAGAVAGADLRAVAPTA
jgi:DNA-binding IscR family transcriptional regulator